MLKMQTYIMILWIHQYVTGREKARKSGKRELKEWSVLAYESLSSTKYSNRIIKARIR